MKRYRLDRHRVSLPPAPTRDAGTAQLLTKGMAVALTEESGVSLDVRLRMQFGYQQRGELADQGPVVRRLGVVARGPGHDGDQEALATGPVGDSDVVRAGVVAVPGLVGGCPSCREPRPDARRLVGPQPRVQLLPLRRCERVAGQQVAVTNAQRLGSACVTRIAGDRRVQLGLPAVQPRPVVADAAPECGDGLRAADGLE